MGAVNSLKYSPLADSIIGKKFRMKRDIQFAYDGYDQNYYIALWKNDPQPGNPKEGSFALQILCPIDFTITDVIKNWDIFNGTQITIKGKILNNIPLDNIGIIYEAIVTDGNTFGYADWQIKSLDGLTTKNIPDINFSINSVNDQCCTISLKTLDIDIVLYQSNLLYIPMIDGAIDYKSPIGYNSTFLEEII